MKHDRRTTGGYNTRPWVPDNVNADPATVRLQQKLERAQKWDPATLPRHEPEVPRPTLAVQTGMTAMVTEPVPKLGELVSLQPAKEPDKNVAKVFPELTKNRPKNRPKFEPLHAFTLVVAIGLAGISAYFSVTGMARIFPGALLAITVMAAIMEGGKLAGVAWLSRNWGLMSWLIRLALIVLVTILAIINALGVFGQLSAAHLDPNTAAVSITNTQAVEAQARIDLKAVEIADLTGRIGQIDAAIAEATKRGRTTAAMELSAAQNAKREALVAERKKAGDELTALKTAQAHVAADQRKASAEIGVLQYAANLFNVDRERMIQVLILAMVLSCDPLSITLVIATARRRQNGDQNERIAGA